MKYIATLLVVTLFFIQNMVSQTADSLHFLRPKSTAAVVAKPVEVPKGTEILFTLEEEIFAADALPEQIVRLTIQEDISVEGRVVFAAGQAATARIQSVRKRGNMGRSARITLEGLLVQTVDNQRIRLDAMAVETRTGRGSAGFAWGTTLAAVGGVALTAATAGIGALILLPIAPSGLMLHGQDVHFEKGAILSFKTAKTTWVKS